MNIEQVKRFLPYAFKVKASVVIHGLHGIGKSSVIKQITEELDIGFIDVRLSQMESGDVLGLPDLSEGTTKFITPAWLPRGEKSKGILFLDEINRARPDVLQAIFQLVLDRRIGEYKLPEGWHVVSAVNPNTDDYQVTNVFDKALLDRFLHLNLKPTTSEFIQYAMKQEDADQNFIQFLQAREELIEDQKATLPSIDRTPSRRSNLMAARLLKTGLDADLVNEGVGGLIGMVNVMAFTTWMQENETKPFTAKEIFADFTKIEERLAKYSDPTAGRHDILSASCENAFNEIETNYKKLKPKQMDNFFPFLAKLPKDLAVSLVKRVIESKTDGVNTWATDSILNDDRSDWIMDVNNTQPAAPAATTEEL